MGAKVIRHPKTGKPTPPKKGAKASSRRRAGRRAQSGRHRGYPDGQGPGGYATEQRQGYAGQGDETVVVCEAPEPTKKKFPWGTVLLTGVVSTVGVIAAYKMYEKFSGEKGGRTSNPEPEPQQGLLNARDYLLLSAPGAETAIGRMPQQPQVINAGVSQREMRLMESNAQLRERMAELEGFLQGQQAGAQQQDSLAALLEAAEAD